MEQLNIKTLEKKAFRSFFRDGIYDLFLGLILLSFGLPLIFNEFGWIDYETPPDSAHLEYRCTPLLHIWKEIYHCASIGDRSFWKNQKTEDEARETAPGDFGSDRSDHIFS